MTGKSHLDAEAAAELHNRVANQVVSQILNETRAAGGSHYGVIAPKMTQAQKRGRGRPSTFDRPVVLREAMKLFWENGYEGTSFEDLISKMSISPSSFYNAFGSKERLYRQATECFLDDAQKWIQGALSKEGATTREAFTHLLKSAAIEFT